MPADWLARPGRSWIGSDESWGSDVASRSAASESKGYVSVDPTEDRRMPGVREEEGYDPSEKWEPRGSQSTLMELGRDLQVSARIERSTAGRPERRSFSEMTLGVGLLEKISGSGCFRAWIGFENSELSPDL